MRYAKPLTVLCCLALAAAAQARPHQPLDPEFESLRHQINLLNLINGLELEPAQAAAWLEVVREAQELQDDFESQIRTLQHGSKATLEELRDVLARGEEPPEVLKSQVHGLTDEVKPLLHQHRQTMHGLAEKALGTLSENQRILFREFRPCMIPPPPGHGPRVGQAAHGRPGPLLHLRRARRASDEQFEQAWQHRRVSRARRLERALGPDGDVEAAEARIREIVDRARELSDEEFEVEAEGLAQQVMEIHHPSGKLLGPGARMRMHMLLTPELIQILEARAG